MSEFSKLEMLAIQDAVSNSGIEPENFRQRLLDKLSAATDEAQVIISADLWVDNLEAWEGEEDSVKEEHADLIERLNAFEIEILAEHLQISAVTWEVG